MIKKFGIINISTNDPFKEYNGTRIARKRPYNLPEHVHFEILEGQHLKGFYWDGSNVVYDINYTLPVEDIQITIKRKIEDAISFYDRLMVDFATENVLMGITQLGKTKPVADYLQNVMRYGQSGSLYEVINEVDTLIAGGVPADLAPFVTVDRLNEMKAEVSAYLAG